MNRTLSATALLSDRFHSGWAWVTVAACVAACIPAGLRWLRVAQREHYLAGSATRFALRWWTVGVNLPLAAVGIVAAVASLRWPVVGVATAAAASVGPIGLTLRGRTAPLRWTRRLKTLAVVWAVLEALAVAAGSVLGPASLCAVGAVVAVPLLVDVACWVTAPLERRLTSHFVDEAVARLARIVPIVVGVTGSFGKTSTKAHIAHLVGPDLTVVASPASFNNRSGLARAVNEHLGDDTQVFVAEMGTYGPGEIADLCRWCPPDVAVITAIGPVHLERFGTEDRIVEAKAEILASAADVVLMVDDPRLAVLADRSQAAGKRVFRCSTVGGGGDVCVVASGEGERVSVSVHGTLIADGVPVPTGVQPGNLACAIGVALALGVEPAVVAGRLDGLVGADHRLQAVPSESGAVILDDTYNANPAGTAAALAALASQAASVRSATVESPGDRGGTGRRVVVTPGMVELGGMQFEANRRFGAAMAGAATDLVVVGRTNRKALLAGAGSVAGARVSVEAVATRPEAVDWVRSHLGPGDVVLYENDLPDHYP